MSDGDMKQAGCEVFELTATVKHRGVTDAIVAFQAEVGTVAKDADNPFFKSKYADLPAVKAAAQPILAKHGLAVIQEPSYLVVGDKVCDTLVTTVIHESGHWDSSARSTMVLKPVKNDPQAQGSAITYARRYAFMAVLGLVADNDDDGNAAAARPRAAKATSKPKDDGGVDGNAINAAVGEIVKYSSDVGVSRADVAGYFQGKYNEPLVGSRNLVALQETAEFYQGEAAKKQLGATEASG